MIKKIYKSLLNTFVSYKKIDFLYEEFKNDYKNSKVLLGKIKAEQNQNKNITTLKDVEFQVFSQFGDDGIIQYLISKLPITNKTFIEFGVENYRESNTRFLLVNNYWSGFVIDGSISNIEFIRQQQWYSFYDLQVECSFITKENINLLLQKSKLKKDVGLLSIDIDGNDYWIWNTIDSVNPVILICEYNSLFGFEHPYTICYEPNFVRGVHSQFNLYGTSLLSIYNLSKSKGYTFIGCNSAGNNSYFIKNDFVKYLDFDLPSLKEGFVFASFSEAWDLKGNALRGLDKINSIHDLTVFNTETNSTENINSSEISSSLVASNKISIF
jgi:hypothetical protein